MVDYLSLFDESFTRINREENRGAFFDRFYERFIGSNEEIASKFKKTEMERQKQMLRASLLEMRDFYERHRQTSYINNLSEVHGARGHAIPSWMYDIWLDSLLATVRELDPDHNDQVQLAWCIVMAPGIAFMRAGYDS